MDVTNCFTCLLSTIHIIFFLNVCSKSFFYVIVLTASKKGRKHRRSAIFYFPMVWEFVIVLPRFSSMLLMEPSYFC